MAMHPFELKRALGRRAVSPRLYRVATRPPRQVFLSSSLFSFRPVIIPHSSLPFKTSAVPPSSIFPFSSGENLWRKSPLPAKHNNRASSSSSSSSWRWRWLWLGWLVGWLGRVSCQKLRGKFPSLFLLLPLHYALPPPSSSPFRRRSRGRGITRKSSYSRGGGWAAYRIRKHGNGAEL